MADTPESAPAPEINPLEKWLFSVAARKMAVAIVGYATSVAITALLARYGVTVDSAALSAALPAAIFSGIVLAHDWVKLKTGWKFI